MPRTGAQEEEARAEAASNLAAVTDVWLMAIHVLPPLLGPRWKIIRERLSLRGPGNMRQQIMKRRQSVSQSASQPASHSASQAGLIQLFIQLNF